MDIYNVINPKIRSVISVQAKGSASQRQNYNATLKYHELIYVVKGKAEIVFDDTIIINKPGDVVFLPQGEHSSYNAKILQEERCIDIFFSADFQVPLSAASQNCLKNPKIPLLFEKLYRVWQQKEQGYYNKCMSLFYSVLSEMELSASAYIPSKKEALLNAALDYIHSHYTDRCFQHGVLPSLCGISYTYFRKLFTERFCVTPSEYVRTLKINYACELLRLERYSVTQISEMCGFSDVYFFSRQFKEYIGITPTQFIKKYRS